MSLGHEKVRVDRNLALELVPNALDQAVHDAVAVAVRTAATTSGIASPDRAASATGIPALNLATGGL